MSSNEQLGIDIAAIEQVHTGEEMTRGQVILNERARDTIRGGRRRGHDAGDQVRLIILTGFGKVHLVADLGDTTLRAIPGLAHPHASSSLAEGHPPVHAAAIPSVPFNIPTTELLASRLTAVVPDAQEESC
jgi:hypothetical protein